MSITSIGWNTDQVIQINKADMTLVQLTPVEIWRLDTNQLFLDLKDAEAAVNGMPWPDTQRNASPVLLGGISYARVLEIRDPYTITFEDGPYVVQLVGSNNNIIEKTNPNQVSVQGNNAAGLIQISEVVEIHTRLGLNRNDPVTDTPAGIVSDSGDIDIARTGDGVSSSKLTRQ